MMKHLNHRRVFRDSRGLRSWRSHPLILALLVVMLVAGAAPPAPAGAAVPAGFQESVVFSGLQNPTVIQFAANGKVFIAEKSGVIKVYDGVDDATPTTFADLRTMVHNFWDRGLLGMAIHPRFPAQPYVYVLYTYDAAIGGTAPRWGTAGATSDGCPSPPGATADGCVVSGRLSRLTAAGDVATGPEDVFIEDWCQQYPSHSIGSLAFGTDGALYASGGDGASFNFADYGQDGAPVNPCGDPPGGPGDPLTPPAAQGGALRSQDLRTSSDPAGLGGSVLRLDPETGAAMPGNPMGGSADPNARRIIAQGLRNPFRFAIRPGTSEVWAGDVGWGTWEEINRVPAPASAVTNFGWPCYEGGGVQAGYDGLNLEICENLYGSAGAVTAPYYAYNHSARVVAGETCATGSSSIAGLAFYDGGLYPAEYNGALFFADYSRDCIWAMMPGTNGLPDPTNRRTFVAAAANPVGLQIGPDGDLFYLDFSGSVRRIRYFSANQPPTAAIAAAPTAGTAPLTVRFDGTSSADPEGRTLTYSWDLDGDGIFDDSTAPTPTRTYTEPASYTVRLRVVDPEGASATDAVTISSNNTKPVAAISSPAAGARWRVGDVITFSGSATDEQDGALPASALSWSLVMQHCPSNCHEHLIQEFTGVSGGSFTAPDHEYPSYLELRLTATDSNGLSDTTVLRLDPQTVPLRFESSPSGLALVVGSGGQAAPFTRTVIVGSSNSITAPSPQTLSGAEYAFASWSDGGARSHTIVAPAQPQTYRAAYTATGPPTSGLKGAYYGNDNFTAPVLTRTDPGVNFDWGFGAPASGVNPDTFSVRWTGQVRAEHTETYTFYTQSDDGVRLWVDGKPIINDWTPHALTEDSGTVALQAGRWYPIRLEFYDGGEKAIIRLAHSSPSTPRRLVPASLLTPLEPPDATPPTATPPTQSLVRDTTLGTTAVPVRLAWSGSDTGSGVARYELEESRNGASYARVTMPSALTAGVTRSLAPGSAYRYRVRAVDGAGNVGAWAEGPAFSVLVHQESDAALAYTGAWSGASSTSYSGGAALRAGAAGASARMTVTGRNVAWVATKASNRGRADVYVDGVRRATVDLYSPSTLVRRLVYVRGWMRSGTHTLEIRALGTKNASSTGTLVDLDAIVVLR